jgi:hypothetical protein
VSCVERDVHRIALGLILFAATAHADDEFVGAPGHALGLAFAGHASHIGATNEGGMGANLEGALGLDRTQYFAEVMLASATLDGMPDVNGYFGRAGVGARWLARQFQPERGGGIEMFLEAVTGVERYWWRDGGTLTRPDLGLGVGVQLRAWQVHGATLRIGSRVMFAPTDRESSLVACRGTGCPAGTATSVAGFVTTVGVAW